MKIDLNNRENALSSKMHEIILHYVNQFSNCRDKYPKDIDLLCFKGQEVPLLPYMRELIKKYIKRQLQKKPEFFKIHVKNEDNEIDFINIIEKTNLEVIKFLDQGNIATAAYKLGYMNGILRDLNKQKIEKENLYG